jgi:hypothetical protein
MNLGTLVYWNPQGLSRPLQGLLYIYNKIVVFELHVSVFVSHNKNKFTGYVGMFNDYIVVILNKEFRGLFLPLRFRCKVNRPRVKAKIPLKKSRIAHPKTQLSIPEVLNC